MAALPASPTVGAGSACLAKQHCKVYPADGRDVGLSTIRPLILSSFLLGNKQLKAMRRGNLQGLSQRPEGQEERKQELGKAKKC